MRDFFREGRHTWDITIDYHRCSECGTIVENRKRYERRMDKWEVDVDCPRCDNSFTVVKREKQTFGPLTGR